MCGPPANPNMKYANKMDVCIWHVSIWNQVIGPFSIKAPWRGKLFAIFKNQNHESPSGQYVTPCWSLCAVT